MECLTQKVETGGGMGFNRSRLITLGAKSIHLHRSNFHSEPYLVQWWMSFSDQTLDLENPKSSCCQITLEVLAGVREGDREEPLEETLLTVWPEGSVGPSGQ
ncbi:uncharacterized protein LOC111242780 isoform X1 [Vigna radiata var. radiata]|uniref:Uncharacterized protein LOC111242780 isoform X1 n=1 Tax=Vigna radiata var. radiata TaxID=3916 RepID=A0A3Q0FHU4_VIGRR|nr:uncharacterized protein LOC111242780 isoform X1 [Vigna radiata var. radiata]